MKTFVYCTESARVVTESTLSPIDLLRTDGQVSIVAAQDTWNKRKQQEHIASLLTNVEDC